MGLHIHKKEQTTQQSLASPSPKKRGRNVFQFVDNRPETIANQRMQSAMNNSPQVQQLKAFATMTNKGPIQMVKKVSGGWIINDAGDFPKLYTTKGEAQAAEDRVRARASEAAGAGAPAPAPTLVTPAPAPVATSTGTPTPTIPVTNNANFHGDYGDDVAFPEGLVQEAIQHATDGGSPGEHFIELNPHDDGTQLCITYTIQPGGTGATITHSGPFGAAHYAQAIGDADFQHDATTHDTRLPGHK
ncbi:MAG: hypothetical protein AAF587_03025 [Bacteroidota bacterium]